MSRVGWLVLAVFVPVVAFAQGAADDQPRVIVVPVPSDAHDAGVSSAPPPVPPPEPVAPPPTPPLNDRPLDNTQPPVPDDSSAQLNPDAIAAPPSAMLDGHPREGSFLSGPGSMTFVVHHTLLGGIGVLATQMVPRVMRSIGDPAFSAFDGDARIAYLVGALVGAGIGFASSATWQFYNWTNTTTATFGLINSIVGAMFAIGITNLATRGAAWEQAVPTSWMGLGGALAGAWLTAILAGGDMPLNKGLLITSGAAWGAIYTALILGIVAATGAGSNLRAGIDTLLFMPAVGATALAIAALKFNPSTEQILRADIFGAGVGAAVLLLSALLVPNQFGSPWPYALAGLTAAGAKVIVSLLWVDTVNAPSALYRDPEKDRPYSRVWW
jgi:hypothetical protein